MVSGPQPQSTKGTKHTMALDQNTIDNVHAVLSEMERRGRLAAGKADAWVGTKEGAAAKETDPKAEIKRLRAKVNRLVAAQDEALAHLTAAKAHTAGDDIKKAQAKVTKAINALAF